MKLVIVESPHKCETIGKYLGKGYEVVASVGHINDLATTGKGGFGVDVDSDFKAHYVISKNKISVANELKRKAASAEEVILATDPDREGEAIAWHLANVLGLDIEKTKRLEFHEITRESIEEAIKNPGRIDMNRVNSQEARRIIDRIIGFKLSGLLQKKIHSRSAGRVQSATLKLITDHDKEIAEFVPEEYYSLSLDVKNNRHKCNLSFESYKDLKKIKNKKDNDLIVTKLAKEAKVIDVKYSEKVVESKPPFSTATMVQEAIAKLHMTAGTVSSTAQALYEGLNSDNIGLVTYIRTESSYLSNTFMNHALPFLKEKYGKEMVEGKRKGKVNGAHEAIRPTSLYRTPESLKNKIPNDQYRLYKLIYNRTIASLMAPKIVKVQNVTFDCGGVIFSLTTNSIKYPGYSLVYKDEEDIKYSSIPSINVGDVYNVEEVIDEQKFTEPPAHYTEAKVVKLMEEKGIGRPSTYASTIKTLKSTTRKYLEVEKGTLVSTDLGSKTTFVLNKYFPDLIDAKYTADMEKDLDKIKNGDLDKVKFLKKFYEKFMKEYNSVSKIMYKDDEVPVGRNCPDCGAPLVYKKSKYGDFIGCSNFPTCHYVENNVKVEYVGRNCPVCGEPLIYKMSKSHKKFIGCSNYPNCDYIESVQKKSKSSSRKCPKCGGKLVLRNIKGKKVLCCENIPNCDYQEEYSVHKMKK